MSHKLTFLIDMMLQMNRFFTCFLAQGKVIFDCMTLVSVHSSLSNSYISLLFLLQCASLQRNISIILKIMCI